MGVGLAVVSEFGMVAQLVFLKAAYWVLYWVYLLVAETVGEEVVVMVG
jgi:hypothetical protein